jgi:hypothetical protein
MHTAVASVTHRFPREVRADGPGLRSNGRTITNERLKMNITKKAAVMLTTATLLAGVGGIATATSASADEYAPYIGYGNTHDGVQCVQHAINNSATPYHILDEDGIFGPDTYNGIVAFQKWWNVYHAPPLLQVDGIVGKGTGTQMQDFAADWWYKCNKALPNY